MMHGNITMPDIGDLTAELVAKADEIDEIAIEVMNETVDFLRDEMKKELKKKIRRKDKSTGNALNAIKSKHAKIRGFYIVASVGALYIRGKDSNGFHLIYIEYGSPTRAATPWLRPVLDRIGMISQFQKEQLRKRGIPVT